MQLLKRLVFACLLISSFHTAQAQDLSMGIRAGLNYSQFLGPQEEGVNESFGLNNGFHFGFNVSYNFSDFLSLRTELLYSQKGTSYTYDDVGFYNFTSVRGDNVGSRTTIIDSSLLKLDVSNAYLSIPLTVHLKTLEKWEFFGGAYINILVSPVTQGSWRFGSEQNPEHSFVQGQNYNYGNDRIGGSTFFSSGDIGVLVNDEEYRIPRSAGAYYQFATGDEIERPYNTIDYGLTAGMAYYLNRGLYLGLKADYGLRDITRNNLDHSYSTLDEDGNLKFSEDFDRNLSFEVSIGFKF